MHSVFGIENKVTSSKIDPFTSVLSYLIHFQAGLNMFPTYPYIFQGIT